MSNAIRRDGDFWEADILDYLRDNFGEQETILDIGANVGNHSLYFATYFTFKKLVAFEPDIHNFSILAKNLERFDRSSFAILPSALSDKQGYLPFRLNGTNWGAHEISEEETTLRVWAEPLDSVEWWIKDKAPITLMKIDAEWHEPQVLAGAQKTIQKHKPLILIEDANNEYEKLLPDYKQIAVWPHHKTYLYRWKS